MLDSVRPAPDPAPNALSVPRLPPVTTSLSALARSENPARSDSAPQGSSAARPRASARRLAGYVALGAGLALVGTATLSLVVSEPEQVVLHGAPAVKRTPKGNEVRWRKKATTVYIDASVDQLGPGARDAIRNAFGTWLQTEAKLPALTFASTSGVRLEAKPDGKNSVIFAPITVKGHERDLAITLTYSDEKTGDIIESDIVINANYPYELLEDSESGPPRVDGRHDDEDEDAPEDDDGDHDHGAVELDADGEARPHVNTAVRSERRSSCVAQQVQATCGRDVYDLENVMTHEVGHFFGLGEDVNDTAATMYVCTNRCETHKRKLTSADASVLTALYAGGFPDDVVSEARAGCVGARFAPAGSPSFAVVAAAVGALLFAARRRR